MKRSCIRQLILGSALVLAATVVGATPANAEHVMTLHEAGLGPPGPFGETCIDPDRAVNMESQFGPYPVDPSRFETVWVDRDGTVGTEPSDPEGTDIRVHVLLPPGYHDDPQRTYPVLYLLHGGVVDADIWFAYPHEFPLHCFTGEREPVILVLPDGNPPWGHYMDYRDGSQLWETFHVRTLVPAIDAEYQTRAERAYRAIAGHSAGAIGAIMIAARNPDVFVSASSISGPLDALGEHHSLHAGTSFEAFCLAGRLVGGFGCGAGPFGPFGDPVTDAVWWRNHNPVDLVPNLRGTSVYAGAGNGVPCDEYDAVHLAFVHYATWGEPWATIDTEAFGEAATEAGVDPYIDLLDCGTHDFPTSYIQLENLWEVMMDALGSPPPADFDHRRVDPEFSVWGWTFTADPDRAPEFLDVTHAGVHGLTLTGSGTTTVTTAPYFEPNEEIAVSVTGPEGTSTQGRTADEDGRLTFTVDLGPPHVHQQFTPQHRALEAADAEYWQTRTIAFGSTEPDASMASCGSSVSPVWQPWGACETDFVVHQPTDVILELVPNSLFTGWASAEACRRNPVDSSDCTVVRTRFAAGRPVDGQGPRTDATLGPGDWYLRVVVGSTQTAATPGSPRRCVPPRIRHPWPLHVCTPEVPSQHLLTVGTSHGALEGVVRPA